MGKNMMGQAAHMKGDRLPNRQVVRNAALTLVIKAKKTAEGKSRAYKPMQERAQTFR